MLKKKEKMGKRMFKRSQYLLFFIANVLFFGGGDKHHYKPCVWMLRLLCCYCVAGSPCLVETQRAAPPLHCQLLWWFVPGPHHRLWEGKKISFPLVLSWIPFRPFQTHTCSSVRVCTTKHFQGWVNDGLRMKRLQAHPVTKVIRKIKSLFHFFVKI